MLEGPGPIKDPPPEAPTGPKGIEAPAETCFTPDWTWPDAGFALSRVLMVDFNQHVLLLPWYVNCLHIGSVIHASAHAYTVCVNGIDL
uniref:Uncharacterized protein n=1 Tax=viral metagenome TaxID=1070528 RepID=A0A6C0DNT1_9ZZZZ